MSEVKKGFFVRCLNCGDEIILKGGIIEQSNDTPNVYPVQGRAIVECDCGNVTDIE